MKSRKIFLIVALVMLISIQVNVPVYGITVTNNEEPKTVIEKKESNNKKIEALNNSEVDDRNELVEGNLQNGNISSVFSNRHKSIQISINGLNYFKPICFNHISKNQYSISLFNKLYEYGKVRLLITQHYNEELSSGLKKEVMFDEILDEDSLMSIELKDNAEYLYNIFILDVNNEIISTHYGLVTIKNGNIGYSIQYISDEETMQTEEKVKSNQLIGTQGVVLKNSIFEDEPNNLKNTANAIESDKNVYGRISSSIDVDYYKITFSSAGTANFWLGDIYIGCDYDLYVYNSNGTEVAHSLNSGQSQELISNLSVTKSTYYVEVRSYGSNFNTSHYYFLRVKLASDSSAGLAWSTIDTTITACFKCDKYKIEYNSIHNGVDVAGTEANPVIAIASGEVYKAYNDIEHTDYGKAVYIDHNIENPNSTGSNDKFFQSRYAHMSEVLVKAGDLIQRGQILGYIGNTGKSDGSHLHFEIATGTSSTSNTRVNPIKFYSGTWKCVYCGGACLNRMKGFDMQSENKPRFTIETYENYNSIIGMVNIVINDEYMFDLEALSYISTQDLEKYGIDEEIINIVIENIKKLDYKDDEVNNYINVLSDKFK